MTTSIFYCLVDVLFTLKHLHSKQNKNHIEAEEASIYDYFKNWGIAIETYEE